MATATPDLAVSVADLIGKPFKLGARGPDFFDCYGLVTEMARRAGRIVPDYQSPAVIEHVAALVTQFVPFWQPCEPVPGAVVTFRIGREVSHVGVLLPHGRFVHSWEKSGGVCTERLVDWEHRIAGFYRFAQ